MRIVFLGSPEFALPSLEALVRGGHDLVAVVTQPDRPAGRGHTLKAPPVKLAAESYGLPVLQPENVSSPESVERLRSLQPDVLIVAAYGQILRRALLDVPLRGPLNVHASLLPRHRGASPVAAAILAGDAVTGVTVMRMVRALDAGPVVAQAEERISDFDTTGSLEPRLAVLGARLLADVLEPWAGGRLQASPQDEALATYAPQIKREDAVIEWSRPAIDLWRGVRAYNPWPVAHTRWLHEDLRILEAWPLPSDSEEAPGTVLGPLPLPAEAGDRQQAFAVQTGDGALAVRRLQRAGGRPVTGAEFLRGRPELIGSRLGS